MSHHFGSGLRIGGVAAAAASLAVGAMLQPAYAQEAQSSSSSANSDVDQSSVLRGLIVNQQDSRATRYRTPDGAVRFVFDRTAGRVALVRFEGDPEVHVLRPVAAAGGDEIYRTEDGDVALRLTRHGTITVYTRRNQMGAPAQEEADVAPLTPAQVAQAQFEARIRELQRRAALLTGAPVVIVTPRTADAYNAGVVLDAAERATQGLEAAPRGVVRRVVITIGSAPQAQLQGEDLRIQVAPDMGYAGRPSSTTIRNVATGERQGPTQ